MVTAIELQVISRILTSTDENEINELCSFDESYYGEYQKYISFILKHRDKYGKVPDKFTFQAEFIDDEIQLVQVNESIDYLEKELKKNKQFLLFNTTFNNVQKLISGDITEAWEYIGTQVDAANQLLDVKPQDIIHDSEKRAETVIEFSKQRKIPTGFPEIDKALYGGWSMIEELAVFVARTNTGKSWICVKCMEAAQKNGFRVAYYSPEMRSEYLATRFDTWRGHFKNSDIYLGRYSDDYKMYIENLKNDETPAYILEDKDFADGVSVKHLEPFIRKEKIQLLIVDGLSYMLDDEKHVADYDKFQHICEGLFQMSKKYNCAVVIAVQANRETKEEKDDKGAPFPNLYHIESSDHIARKATQVFGLRQIFETHVLDIKLLKSRTSGHVNECWSYAWDINNGNMQYVPSSSDNTSPDTAISSPTIAAPMISVDNSPSAEDANLLSGLGDDNVEF